MERKLASIQKITNKKPIEGADLIEVVEVNNGWEVVCKKDEFQIGDKVIYFEIDSYLPITEQFEFLRKSCYKKMGEKEGFRLKTIKLRGQLSQGLVVPLSILDGKVKEEDRILELDVTDTLEILKYEPPIPMEMVGKVEGSFPSFIRKTDQERIQNLYGKYKEKYEDEEFEVSIKLDGSSLTIFGLSEYKNHTEYSNYFGICSRNYEVKLEDNNTFVKVGSVYKDKLMDYVNKNQRNLAIQGELIGYGIQRNNEGLNHQDFYCFDIWDIDKQVYLTNEERDEICKEVGIKVVPILETIKLFKKFNNLKDILEYAEGTSLFGKRREGLVLRSINPLNKEEIISFKIIANSYLLKE